MIPSPNLPSLFLSSMPTAYLTVVEGQLLLLRMEGSPPSGLGRTQTTVEPIVVEHVDVEAVLAWLRAQGLTVELAPNGQVIPPVTVPPVPAPSWTDKLAAEAAARPLEEIWSDAPATEPVPTPTTKKRSRRGDAYQAASVATEDRQRPDGRQPLPLRPEWSDPATVERLPSARVVASATEEHPYACTITGCGMTFRTEHGLTVHYGRKHGMGTGTAKTVLRPATPTPEPEPELVPAPGGDGPSEADLAAIAAEFPDLEADVNRTARGYQRSAENIEEPQRVADIKAAYAAQI